MLQWKPGRSRLCASPLGERADGSEFCRGCTESKETEAWSRIRVRGRLDDAVAAQSVRRCRGAVRRWSLVLCCQSQPYAAERIQGRCENGVCPGNRYEAPMGGWNATGTEGEDAKGQTQRARAGQSSIVSFPRPRLAWPAHVPNATHQHDTDTGILICPRAHLSSGRSVSPGAVTRRQGGLGSWTLREVALHRPPVMYVRDSRCVIRPDA